MSAKDRFCRIAHEMVKEEATGILEYEKFLVAAAEVHNKSTSDADKAQMRSIVDWLEEARSDEQKHERRAAFIIASVCR